MKIYRIASVSLGLGLLFAWMQSIFLASTLYPSSAGRIRGGMDFIPFFLAVHALTYLVRGWTSTENFFHPTPRALYLSGAGMMITFPLFMALASFFPLSFALPAVAAGLLFSASGSALLIGQWSELLSSFQSEDVALVFGLSPLVAALMIFLSTPLNPLFFLVAAPLFSALLFHFFAKEAIQEENFSAAEDFPELPFWRVALFLFCFYGANGFLMSIFPRISPPPVPGAEKMGEWVRTFSALGVAAVFRYYPRTNLSNFYRGAFPFLGFSLFLFSFSPFRYISRLFLEGGLAFLDLYAWLLLFFFASHAGKKRTSVIHWGLFIVVLASAGSHLHLLLKGNIGLWPGESTLAPLMFLALLFLLLLLALWDGRELPLQWNWISPVPVGKKPERVASGGETPLLSSKDGMEEEMAYRMRLLPYNLTRQETEISLLLLEGNKDESICSSLFISRNTLKFHLRNIYRKIGIANRTELRKEIL